MKRLINTPALLLLKFYKACVSPFLPRACRFEPSCSVYALGCFEKFGFIRACRLTLCRLMRCHPFHPGGYDPVPEQRPAERRGEREESL